VAATCGRSDGSGEDFGNGAGNVDNGTRRICRGKGSRNLGSEGGCARDCRCGGGSNGGRVC
jgi:hypothetical protein